MTLTRRSAETPLPWSVPSMAQATATVMVLSWNGTGPEADLELDTVMLSKEAARSAMLVGQTGEYRKVISRHPSECCSRQHAQTHHCIDPVRPFRMPA